MIQYQHRLKTLSYAISNPNTNANINANTNAMPMIPMPMLGETIYCVNGLEWY